ncbi:MAG: hypothetical protein IPL99_11890 [Candidatus Competibacteraceae bacterium]|nr:hypothetical protein [Candidatus Competibacteraceae bacterium]
MGRVPGVAAGGGRWRFRALWGGLWLFRVVWCGCGWAGGFVAARVGVRCGRLPGCGPVGGRRGLRSGCADSGCGRGLRASLFLPVVSVTPYHHGKPHRDSKQSVTSGAFRDCAAITAYGPQWLWCAPR